MVLVHFNIGVCKFSCIWGFLDLGLLKLMNFELGITCIRRISKFSTKPFYCEALKKLYIMFLLYQDLFVIVM